MAWEREMSTLPKLHSEYYGIFTFTSAIKWAVFVINCSPYRIRAALRIVRARGAVPKIRTPSPMDTHFSVYHAYTVNDHMFAYLFVGQIAIKVSK